MELILPYYQEYINVVASFVEEMGRSHGAGREEATQLRLVGEETFIFIMNGIPKTGLDTMFHLRCVEEEEGLLFLFTNHGFPLHQPWAADEHPRDSNLLARRYGTDRRWALAPYDSLL